MSTKAQQSGRLERVDVLRGIAVVFMLWMHTADGWLRPHYRQTELWSLVRTFGGMAAPLFMWLAGLSLALVWHRRGGQVRPSKELPRALQLVVLGYALRLQMWVVDGAGFALPSAWMPLLAGYLALYFALGGRPAAPRPRVALAALGMACVVAGLWRVEALVPQRLDGLSRVDILQAIGASLALTTLLAAAIPVRARGVALGVAAAAVALATHAMRGWVPGPLSGALAGYLAYWRPVGPTMPMALFPLFPWLAYALAGAAIGAGMARAAQAGHAGRHAMWLAAAGLALALASDETSSHVRAWLAAEPWLTQPARVAYRLGVGLCYAGVAAVLAHPRSPLARPLVTLGRASLFVYWVHLQFAFGLLAGPLKHRLEPLPWLAWLAVLVVAMWALAAATEGLRGARRDAGTGSSDGGITKARMGLVT